MFFGLSPPKAGPKNDRPRSRKDKKPKSEVKQRVRGRRVTDKKATALRSAISCVLPVTADARAYAS